MPSNPNPVPFAREVMIILDENSGVFHVKLQARSAEYYIYFMEHFESTFDLLPKNAVKEINGTEFSLRPIGLEFSTNNREIILAFLQSVNVVSSKLEKNGLSSHVKLHSIVKDDINEEKLKKHSRSKL